MTEGLVESFLIQTHKVKVGKKYFSFNFIIHRNGKLVKKGTYDSSHSRSPSYIRKILKNGYATELALEQL